MPLLTEFTFPKNINTSTNDIIKDFFQPALTASIRYDRGVGYFSAGWLRIASEGMTKFANNCGVARWVTSPILNDQDWQALRLGESAKRDKILKNILMENIKDLKESLEEDTLNALAWLIADEILEFKLAITRNLLNGEFHDKFGIFTDEAENQVSFNGSYNDSIQGIRNYEALKVFCSWDDSTVELVRADMKRFNTLWNNMDPNVRVYNLPDAAKYKIIKLREEPRPYNKLNLEKHKNILNKTNSSIKSIEYQVKIPEEIELRDYQITGINAWIENNFHGILEMATGTGKTITAIAASVDLYKKLGKLIIVISCPYTHLTTQWKNEIEKFGYKYIFAFGSSGPWEDHLANQIFSFKSGYLDNLVILTTHNTFSDERFIDFFENEDLPLLLIVDEVHDIGAPVRQKGLLESFKYRLGLSATPSRWLDPSGTDIILKYFKKVVFEFPLEKAIPEYLTPYEYYPYFIELTNKELSVYEEKTNEIISRVKKIDHEEDDELLKLYFILRQQVIVNAENKFSCIKQILKSLKKIDHTLIYCSPQQIDGVQKILNQFGIIQSRFTGEENLSERDILLKSFDKGDHEVLVAMKCLDQGVDVPSTRQAIILASSGNPKEFIQRRGRILRKFPGKIKAEIHDVIVIPKIDKIRNKHRFKLERNILKRELKRYYEFANIALNRIHAISKIGPIERKYLITGEKKHG